MPTEESSGVPHPQSSLPTEGTQTQSSWYSGQRQPLKRERRVAVCTVTLGGMRSEETFQVENTVRKAGSEGA